MTTVNNIGALLILILGVIIPVTAQEEDPVAGKILDDFKAKIQSYPAIQSEFRFTIIDMKENSESSLEGKLSMKGEKYVLKMGNMEIYYDGQTIWSYLPEEQEVNINESSEITEGEGYFDNPMRFFTLYKKDFFYKFIDERTTEGKTMYIIDLYPKDLEKGVSRIRILIVKQDLSLYSARCFGKDGMHYLLYMTNMTSKPLPDSWFRFDPLKHPGIEVIDLR